MFSLFKWWFNVDLNYLGNWCRCKITRPYDYWPKVSFRNTLEHWLKCQQRKNYSFITVECQITKFQLSCSAHWAVWAVLRPRGQHCVILLKVPVFSASDCDRAVVVLVRWCAWLIVSNLLHWQIFWPLRRQCRDDREQRGASVTPPSHPGL